MSIVHEYKIYSERALETGRKASLWRASEPLESFSFCFDASTKVIIF